MERLIFKATTPARLECDSKLTFRYPFSSQKQLRTASGLAWSFGILSLLYAGFRALPREGQAGIVLVVGVFGSLIGGVAGTVYVFSSA